MKTALISDMHGNYNGLLATLEDIKQQNCDRIISLGDLVEGGEQDAEVIAEIQKLNIPSVRGNHDEYNDLIDFHLIDYLRNLPEEIIENNIMYTHISPRKKKYTENSQIIGKLVSKLHPLKFAMKMLKRI